MAIYSQVRLVSAKMLIAQCTTRIAADWHHLQQTPVCSLINAHLTCTKMGQVIILPREGGGGGGGASRLINWEFLLLIGNF